MLLLSAEVELDGALLVAALVSLLVDGALLVAALVSLLVEGVAALLAELAVLVSVLPIDEVGPGLLAPQWSATSLALVTWNVLFPMLPVLLLVPVLALGLLALGLLCVSLGFEPVVLLELAALAWPVTSTSCPALPLKLSVLPVRE